MGSSGSRPGPHKVTPQNDLRDEGARPKPQWTLPALSVTVEQPPGSLGHRRRTLPPLREEPKPSTPSGTFVCCIYNSFAVLGLKFCLGCITVLASSKTNEQLQHNLFPVTQGSTTKCLSSICPGIYSHLPSLMLTHWELILALLYLTGCHPIIISPQALQPLVAQMSCTHNQSKLYSH